MGGYHVSAGVGASCSFEQIDDAYSLAAGETDRARLKQFSADELSRMDSHFEQWFGPCDSRHTAAAIRVYQAFASLDVTFSNTRLLSEGMEPPPSFCDYIATCVRTGQSELISEQMQAAAH